MENNQQNYQNTKQDVSKTRARLILIIIFLIFVIASIILYMVIINSSKNQTDTCNEITKQLEPAEVNITKNGFEPLTVTVKKCQQVSWTNQDSQPHRVAADPYPTSSSYPEFVGPALIQKDSFTFTFEKTGTYTYHDQLNPFAFKGSIIVK